MFINTNLDHLFFSYVEEQKYELALDLIINNGLKHLKRASGFINFCKESKNLNNWLEMLKKIASIDCQLGNKTVLTHVYIQDIINASLESSYEPILVSLINNIDYQKVALTSLAKDHKHTPLLINILIKLDSKEQQSIIFEILIQLGLEKYNGVLLRTLKKLDAPFDFNGCLKDLNLSSKEQEKCHTLLDMAEKKAIYVNEKMKAFVNGYGNIQYQDALFTMAQMRARKNYNYETVLLDLTTQDFNNFLMSLASMPKPVTQSFMGLSKHAISGEIEITENNQVTLWIIDPLGTNTLEDLEDDEESDELIYHDQLLSHFAKIFPGGTINIAADKRQYTGQGCSVFALYDTHNIHRPRLLPKYEKTGMQGYLDDLRHQNLIKTVFFIGQKEKIKVTLYPLPLSFTRTTQSRCLQRKIIPNRSKEEQEAPVNKKGDNASKDSERFFKVNEKSELQNGRLDYILQKMIRYNWLFLKSHSIDNIEEKMNFFTLSQYKIRIKEFNCIETNLRN